jgi:hypothetical protein
MDTPVKRFVILRIDDIYGILKDYAGEALGLPDDAKPVRFRFVAGKLQIMLDADSWEHDQPGEQIKFDLRRIWSVS